MKGAKNSSIVVNFSRDTFVEEIDDETLEEEEQEVPELETAVNVCLIVSFGPLIFIIVRTILLPILICTQESTFRSC